MMRAGTLISLVICRFVLSRALVIDNQLKIIKNDCFERFAIGHKLNTQDVYESVEITTVKDCQRRCTLDEEKCRSFSFGIGTLGNATCNLSSKILKETATLKPIGTLNDPDFDLYIKKLGCKLVLEEAPEITNHDSHQSLNIPQSSTITAQLSSNPPQPIQNHHSSQDQHHSSQDQHHSSQDQHHSSQDQHHSSQDQHHSSQDQHHSSQDHSRPSKPQVPKDGERVHTSLISIRPDPHRPGYTGLGAALGYHESHNLDRNDQQFYRPYHDYYSESRPLFRPNDYNSGVQRPERPVEYVNEIPKPYYEKYRPYSRPGDHRPYTGRPLGEYGGTEYAKPIVVINPAGDGYGKPIEDYKIPGGRPYDGYEYRPYGNNHAQPLDRYDSFDRSPSYHKRPVYGGDRLSWGYNDREDNQYERPDKEYQLHDKPYKYKPYSDYTAAYTKPLNNDDHKPSTAVGSYDRPSGYVDKPGDGYQRPERPVRPYETPQNYYNHKPYYNERPIDYGRPQMTYDRPYGYGKPQNDYDRPHTDYDRPNNDFVRPTQEGYDRPPNDYVRPNNESDRPDNAAYDKPPNNYDRPTDVNDRPDNVGYERPPNNYDRPTDNNDRPTNINDRPSKDYASSYNNYNRPTNINDRPTGINDRPSKDYANHYNNYDRPSSINDRPSKDYANLYNNYDRPPKDYERPNNHNIDYGSPNTNYDRPPNGYERPTSYYDRPPKDYDRPSGYYDRPPKDYDRPSGYHDRPSKDYGRPQNYDRPPSYMGADFMTRPYHYEMERPDYINDNKHYAEGYTYWPKRPYGNQHYLRPYDASNPNAAHPEESKPVSEITPYSSSRNSTLDSTRDKNISASDRFDSSSGIGKPLVTEVVGPHGEKVTSIITELSPSK